MDRFFLLLIFNILKSDRFYANVSQFLIQSFFLFLSLAGQEKASETALIRLPTKILTDMKILIVLPILHHAVRKDTNK